MCPIARTGQAMSTVSYELQASAITIHYSGANAAGSRKPLGICASEGRRDGQWVGGREGGRTGRGGTGGGWEAEEGETLFHFTSCRLVMLPA